jgi:hypothetical protein
MPKKKKALTRAGIAAIAKSLRSGGPRKAMFSGHPVDMDCHRCLDTVPNVPSDCTKVTCGKCAQRLVAS